MCSGTVVAIPPGSAKGRDVAIRFESSQLYEAQRAFIASRFRAEDAQKLKSFGLRGGAINWIRENGKPIRHHSVFKPTTAQIFSCLAPGKRFDEGDELFRYGETPITVAVIPSPLLVEIEIGSRASIQPIAPGSSSRIYSGHVIDIKDRSRDFAEVLIDFESPSLDLFDTLVAVRIDAPSRHDDLNVVFSEHWPQSPEPRSLPELDRTPVCHSPVPARSLIAPERPAAAKLRATMLASPADHIDIEAERAVCAATIALAVKNQLATIGAISNAAVNRLPFSRFAELSALERVKTTQHAMIARGALLCPSLIAEVSVAGNNITPTIRLDWQRDAKDAAISSTSSRPSAKSLSVGQENALRAIKAWWSDGSRPIFRLAGFAGTGKTTVAAELSSALGCTIAYAAYTGKAASILRQKGVAATTIHAGLYTYRQDETGHSFRYVDPSLSLGQSDLIVLDESSMLGVELLRDLLTLNKPIVLLGDSMQLPPIGAKSVFGSEPADFTLTEIHRQARDNPIIAMSLDLRNHGSFLSKEYGESRIIKLADLPIDNLMLADQVIAGRKATCHRLNQKMRHLWGRNDPLPEPGDKLVCLKNNKHRRIYNGEVWTVVSERHPVDDETFKLELDSEDNGRHLNLPILAKPFITGEMDPAMSVSKDNCFDYGNALTAHKAQGSEWSNVIVFDESSTFGANAPNWLYTVVTRASERITVVQI